MEVKNISLKQMKKQVLFLTLTMTFALLISGAVSADNYVGGQNLTTENGMNGTVSGGLYVDATPAPNWGSYNVTKTFTLPAAATGSNITEARLYISAYCGHMQDDKTFTITNKFDGNGDGTYETTWTESEHEAFEFFYNPLTGETIGNDNSEFTGHGTNEPYLIINDHENRVTSDYFMWYDVTSLIQGTIINVNVNTTGSYDGRIKMITLIVAYNDGDSDQIMYWVNKGHDVCSYYTENYFQLAAVGSTTFKTSSITGTVESANLTVDYLASNNGNYGFPTTANNFTYTGGTPPVEGTFTNALDNTPDVQGAYSGVDSWNVTSVVANASTNNSDVTLGYTRNFSGTGTAAFYKIPLAILTVKLQGTPTPVADFTATPTTGTTPLTVQFTDSSTNNPTSWLWEYDSGSGWITFASGTDSEAQNPQHTFTIPGTYNIRLTVSNSYGGDDEIKLGFITVNSLRVTNTRTGLTYNNIQEAIDDNLTLNGDTITVKEDTYTENITINKQLTLNTTGPVTVQPVNVNLPVFTVNTAGSGSTITGFTITGATNNSGISLESTDDCNITGNNINGNSMGVKLYNSNSNTITGNTIQNNTWAGICLDNSTGNTINNTNIVSSNQEGIFLANNSNNNTITSNNIHDNTGVGINILSNSNGNTVQNNTTSSNGVMGIFIQNSNTNTITGNTAQNNGWAGICLDNATGNTINNTNIVSSNQEGIFLANNSNSNTITGNNIHNNNGAGINILNSSNNNQITSNSGSSNGMMGVFVQNSNTNTITGNTIQNNGWTGICLDQATGNTISTGNLVTGNQEGIFLANNSNGNFIQNNTVESNTGNGINILNSSTNNIGSNNQIRNNGVSGIFIQNSTNIIVYNNTMTSNSWGGVILDTATNTTVYNNNFNNNYEQALAVNGTGNTFYEGNSGNYYNDWTTTDPRPIDGNENLYDQYPSLKAF